MFSEQKPNDQKPKSSGLVAEKLILAAVIVFSICLIMVFGVAGYLRKNKEIINHEPVAPIVSDVTVTSTPIITPDVSENIDDWKTYRNEEYGFEFKYPAIYDEKEEFQSCSPKESINAVEPYLFVSVAGRVWVQVLNSEGLNLSEYVDKKTKQDLKIESRKNGMIDGNESIEISYRILGSNAWGEAAFILKNKNIYAFSLERPNFECDAEIDNISIYSVYNKVLSTFKFTEKSVNYKTQTFIDLMNQNLKFKSFMEEILKVNPLMTVDNFSVSRIQNLDETRHSYYSDYVPEDKNDPRWIFSPDGEKAVSIYGMFGEPDSSLDLYNRQGDKKTDNLLFCGTSCSYLAVYWLNSKQFVFVESGEDYVKDEIKYALSIHFYDIENNTKIGYQSQLSDKNPIIPKNSEWRARRFSVCKKINQNEASCAYLK